MSGKVIQMIQFNGGIMFLTDTGAVYHGYPSDVDGAWSYDLVVVGGKW